MRRHKHREEVQRLRAELLALQSSSKGGSQAMDRHRKDLEKTKCARQMLAMFMNFNPV